MLKIFKKFRKVLPIAMLLLGAFLVRILLSPQGNHIDLIINSGWGGWLWENGPRNFYTNNVWIYAWPTQLPFINLIYAYNFHIYERILWYIAYFGEVIITHNVFPQYFGWLFSLRGWFGTDLYMETPFTNGILVSMKVIPIITDLVIAIVIFIFGRNVSTPKKAFFVSLLYLILPFSWYESALWGQYDQLSSLLVVLAFLGLLWKKIGSARFIIPPVLFLIAFQIKPTVLFLAPFFGIVYLLNKPKILEIILGFILSTLFLYYTFRPFVSGNFVNYVSKVIFPVVFNNDRYGLVNHAFNFWQFLAPFGGWSTTFKLLWIKALYWGVLFWGLFTLWAVLIIRKRISIKNLLICLYLISGGSYMFMTGMVDRYYYIAVVILSFLVFYYPKLLKWWIVSMIIFSINLFYSWGFPFLTSGIAWKSMYIIRTFSLAQITVFLLTLKSCLK